MEQLQSYHDILVRNFDKQKRRYLYDQIDWSVRMIAIRGARGTGKTTLMLQRIKELSQEESSILYITLEHPYFYHHQLFDFVQEFYALGGRHLFIDEVHKYTNWSQELKVIYDGFPDLRVVFSASSALDIHRGQADLSRRVDVYVLAGLSFREYLTFTSQAQIAPVSLDELVNNAQAIARTVTNQVTILPLFNQYLTWGYYPFHLELSRDQYQLRLARVINTVIESDLAHVDRYQLEASLKVKKLLGVVAESVPFKPNVSALARKTEMSRDLIYEYLVHLEKAHLLHLLYRQGKGISTLQKPDKIYLDNTNLAFALRAHPDRGNLRETFLLNQVANAMYTVFEPSSGDFFIEDSDLHIEVGGRNKSNKQVRESEHHILAKDNVEVATKDSIPLWLFGFLY